MIQPAVRLVLLAALVAMPAAGGHAQVEGQVEGQGEGTKAEGGKAEPAEPAATEAPDPVVAKVNGKPIYRSEIILAQQALPQQFRQMPIEVVYGALLSQVINRKLIVAEARRQGFEKDPAVTERLAEIEEGLIREVYLGRRVEAQVTDAKLRERYERVVKEMPAQQEVQARHILVRSEEEAVSLIAELNKGADFAETAKKNSVGPSAAQGGDLGYFSRDQMAAAFAEAAFGLKKGEMTQAPVETRFGWHVIVVEDIREAPPPSFEEKEEELRNEMSREVVSAEIEGLREGAMIERFNLDGSPLDEPATKSAK
ncbi:MAG: peptidylprolyl isomerase [Alphaproteobacteria bacterium]